MSDRKTPSALLEQAIKETRSPEWTPKKIVDVLLLEVICQAIGLPAVESEERLEQVVRRLEEKEGVPATEILGFVLRSLDYGWLGVKEPYGYDRRE